MSEAEAFKGQKKLRKSELITPPNTLKKKVGSGGLDAATLARAQDALDNTTIDFKPIALELIDALANAIQSSKDAKVQGEEAIEAMLYPAMQLKAQGAMFRYPLVTDIADILIDFLETVSGVDKDVIDVVAAHKMAISVIINSSMTGKDHPQGKALPKSLLDACERYYKTRKT